MRHCLPVLATLLLADPLSAAMTYDVRSIESGKKFIIISGTIEITDDLLPLRRLIEMEQPSAVTFYSPGGNVVKAMELGRMIRAAGLITFQIRSSECASACALAFMGGIDRGADPGSIGVHKASFSDSSNVGVADAVAAVQQLTAEEIGYMAEMGVDSGLLQLALQYDSDDIRYLSASEMKRYRITTDGPDKSSATASAIPLSAPSSASSTVASAPVQSQTSYEPQISLAIPVPQTGTVMHPKDKASLRVAPAPNARAIKAMPNGTPIDIANVKGDWFYVRSNVGQGYMHKTWIRVGEYEENSNSLRFIQVKSFDSLVEAEAFVSSSRLPMEVHLASNSWFAVTLAGSLPESEALDLARHMKAEGTIPDDSMITLGNTYVRRVCCL